MKKKPVKSTDPRKRRIMEALKSVSGGNKITNVKEDSVHYFGKAMKKVDLADGGYGYQMLGEFKIEKSALDGG